MKYITYVSVVVIALFVAGGAEAAPAGSILMTTGEATISGADGVGRPTKVGMEVNSGDRLATRNGQVQIRFTDGGLIGLQPATEFKISNYIYASPEKQPDAAVFELIKGGLRSITGLIGKTRKEAYKMYTPVATIGIRGTEYQAVVCTASCKTPDGLYVYTERGTIFVMNAKGEIEVSIGQSGYVASANVAPQRTTLPPAFSIQGLTQSIDQGRTVQPTNVMNAVSPSTVASPTSVGGVAGIGGVPTVADMHESELNKKNTITSHGTNHH